MEQPLLDRNSSPTALPNTQSMFGFQVEDEVIFDGVAKITGFNPERGVQLDFHGKKIWSNPRHLRKTTVNPQLERVLRIFCGYIDVWFLRETFVTDFAPDKTVVSGRVEDQANMIFTELGMEKDEMGKGWTRIHPLVYWTFGLYLRKVLSPSVYFYNKHTKALSAVMGSILFLLLLVSLSGFVNLRSGDTDEQANARGVQAFSAVEHAPVTPFILALCTHVIMMIFALEQHHGLMQSDWRNLAFPLTYTIFVGKCFMIFRMVLAYSSKNLGVSIDYFLWQELILTTLHACLAPFVGDPVAPQAAAGRYGSAAPPLRVKGQSYAKQLSNACLVVFCIDLMKTLAVVIYWWTYREGAIAHYFNRLPNIEVMLAASVLVHAVLDLIQFTVTVFTMLIGRIFLALTTDQSLPEYQEVEEEERKPDVLSAKPAAEIAETVEKLSGSWLVDLKGNLTGLWYYRYRQYVDIEVKHWMMQVPDGLDENKTDFQFPTVYRYGTPEVFMTVKIPKGLRSGTAGSAFWTTELRISHNLYGLHSIDASRLESDFSDGLFLLYKGYERQKYSSAQWIESADGPMIKFEGAGLHFDKTWHRPRQENSSWLDWL